MLLLAPTRRSLVTPLALSLGALLGGVIPGCSTPGPFDGPGLPPGRAVLDRFLEVTGGRAAHEGVKTRVTRGEFDLPMVGAVPFVMYQRAPAQMATIADIAGAGEINRGNDGTHAWESISFMGPRLLSGPELEESNRESMIAADLHADELYKSIECVGIEPVGAEECYRVELITKAGGARTHYYSKATGLLVRMSLMVKTQLGQAKSDSTVSDYRDVGGIKMPFKTVAKVSLGLTNQLTVTLTSIEHNVPIEDAKFAPPKAVQDLIDKQEAAAPASDKPR